MSDIVERLRLQFNADEMRPTYPVTVECIELEMACAEIDRLRDWQRRAVVELTLAQYRLRDHPDQDGFNNMRALIEEADHE